MNTAVRAPGAEPEGTGSGIFYGWYVVGAVFILMTVTAGLGFYALSVYLKAFVVERGFSVSATSTATACFFIASGFSGLVVASLIERYDPRRVITAGAFVGAFATLFAGHVTELWQLYFFYAIFGIGYSGAALIPGTTLVARWFVRRRSIALSYASTGLSFGGIVLTPVAASMIERIGLEAAVPWLAFMFIIGIVPVTWFFIRPSPQAMGMGPDGDVLERSADGTPVPADGIAFKPAIKSRFFVFGTLAFIFAMMAQVGVIAHLFRLVSMRSGSDDTAALAVAVMAAFSIIGRLAGGWALAYISSRRFVFALTILQALALASFAIAESIPAIIIATICFGLTVGNLLMMQPLMLAEAFGLKAYGRIYSFNQLFMTLGVASGPAIIGLLYEGLGGYGVAFLVMGLSSLLAFVFILIAGPVNAMLMREGNNG